MPTPDPCQALVDKVNTIAREPVATDPNGKPNVALARDREARLEQAEAELAACRKAQLKVTVKGADAPSLSKLDAVVQGWMIDNQVALGQLTVLKNGKVELEHAYTGSWTGHHDAETNSLFRIASISKAFTCAAIQNLFDAGSLAGDNKVFALLGITRKALDGQTPDPNVDSITVQDLLGHAGGWNDGAAFEIPDKTDIPGYPPGTTIPSSGYDPVFYCREIGQKLSLNGPPTKRQIAHFMYGEPLQFKPGVLNYGNTGGKTYSNFGYVLLGLVVELESGMPYVDYVRKQVLAPIGIDDVFLSRMLAGGLYREVGYDDPGSGPCAFEPDANVNRPSVSGGANLVTELCDSGGGLMATATALAKFIGHYPAWGVGHGRSQGSSRTGSEPGVTSRAASLENGVDLAYVFNTRALNAEQTLFDSLSPLAKAV